MVLVNYVLPDCIWSDRWVEYFIGYWEASNNPIENFQLQLLVVFIQLSRSLPLIELDFCRFMIMERLVLRYH